MHRVLLVDDEIYARKGLRSLIDWEALGYQVIEEADNGEDALDLIQKLEPDLVLTDIRMPEVDGIELIRRATEGPYPKPGFIIISGYNDFRYAQQAVRYGVHDFILKPVDEGDLQATLRKLDEKLQRDKTIKLQREQYLFEEALASFIRRDFEPGQLEEWKLKLDLVPDEALYYVFAEANDHQAWDGAAHEPLEKHHLQEALQEMTGTNKQLYVHQHRNRLGLIVKESMLDADQGSIARFALRLRKELERRIGYNIFIYVSKPILDLGNIAEAYQSAKDCLLYKFVQEQDRIVLFDEVKDKPLNYVDVDTKLYERLTESMEEQDEEQIDHTIQQIFAEFQTKRFAPEAVKLTIHRSVSAILKIIRELEADEASLATLEPIVSWQDTNISLATLQRLFANFVAESSDLIAKSRKDNIKGGIKKIKEYIESNFHENLNLKGIAAQFYMNPVYLGQLFKKTYGMYFNEFLLQLRIQEAKKLLRQTDLRIYEIADRIGFSNPDYFVTQFEKIENATPTEYRNKLLK